ncbi:MAG TPA: universal stress protein [Candidatus Limnocylindrales bacterium]|jgi:nucleotide-binding universal stress UspA family protein
MRILLAVDGSVSSDRATQLVASFPLPPDSVVRVVSIQQPFTDVLAMSWAAVGSGNGNGVETEEQIDARHHREAVERAEITLRRPGLKVEGFLLRGRPGSSIVDEASAFKAELVVMGSRGHGAIATMVLGSTASEVVDHAPCPVFVARSNSLGSIAFADDGSTTARTAETVFTKWPLFAGRHIDVLTVAETAVPVAAGFTPGLYDQVLASYARSVDDAREQVANESATAAQRLHEAGLDAAPVVLEGEAAGEIVRFAAERGTGTIVMGTRGHTGIARLFLGSVARNVLLHAPCSVLVVRNTA